MRTNNRLPRGFRFVKSNPQPDRNYWTNLLNTGKKNAWSGYAFEQVCLHHIDQIKFKLGIPGIASNIYAWKQEGFTDADGNEWAGGQIDLIIDRSDRVINLYEMKYSNDEYSISKQYAGILRNRTSLFRHVEKTKKDLRITFITTYGIKKNEHSGIVDNEVVLADLITDPIPILLQVFGNTLHLQ